MSSLSNLTVSLHQATLSLARGFSFDAIVLDREVCKLRQWLGDRGSAKPPQDAIHAAVGAFFQDQHLQTSRQAILTCFGCVDAALPDGGRLIEDRARFPRLLEVLDDYLPHPRAFRLCYRGLLNAYFGYEVERGRPEGKPNWEHLRSYLNDKVENTIAPGTLPTWVEGLRANLPLLGADPGGFYGRALLEGNSEQFDQVCETLAISQNSWLVWQVVLGHIDAATSQGDRAFQQLLPSLLGLLPKHPLAIDKGVARLLNRYRRCANPVVHPALRDFAVARWGNPWLTLNKAKWSLVGEDARAMVAGWLKLVLIQKFFSLLTEDGSNDTRRLKFWEKYHDSIDDMYFALGHTAMSNSGTDFRNIRKQMEGRLLSLIHGGPSDNNAFIMCMGNYVVVEFGLKGNACFIFDRANLPFKLDGHIAGNSEGLKYPRYVDRLLHFDGSFETWESKFKRTLDRLMSVRPATQPIKVESPVQPSASPASKPINATQPSGSSQPQLTTVQGRVPGLEVPARPNPAPPRGAFSDEKLSQFCDRRNLQIRDLRGWRGNLWVNTDESDELVSSQLRAWGFIYKPGKGWWRQ